MTQNAVKTLRLVTARFRPAGRDFTGQRLRLARATPSRGAVSANIGVYDPSGNVTADGGFHQYLYDAESRIHSVSGNPAVVYTYDGHGQRVQKSGGKLYWYGLGGEVLDEPDLSGNLTDEYVYFGGRRVARRALSNGGVYYYAQDHLGTSRVMVQGNGMLCSDADFEPFGVEHSYNSTCAQNYKFTGKERDTESGLDDFGARYYSSTLGRWMSADWSAVPAPVPYANLNNPQTLNLYAMVGDNPETFADLDGHHFSGNLALDAYALFQRAEDSTTPPPPPQDKTVNASASGTVATHDDHAGPVKIRTEIGKGAVSARASHGSTSAGASASATGSVTSETVASPLGTTTVKTVSGDASLHASASLEPGKGISAGASANVDVISATHTASVGGLTISLTASVGIGGNASFSLSTSKVSASAGLTDIVGGSLSFSYSF